MKALASNCPLLKKLSVWIFLLFPANHILAQCTGFPATTADADCAGGTTVTNNANINSGNNYGFCGPNSTTYSFSGINLSGGVLRICGNANISGNFNSGTIVVSCGATANFTSGLTLNSGVGIINYGTINVTGNLTYQNSNNYVYNESSTSVMNVSGDINFPNNNGQNAYLKNSGTIKVSGNFNAYDGGFTCFMAGGQMQVNNLNYIVNCGGPANRFTFGSSSGTAILRYTGAATLKAVFTASSNWNIYKATGATQTLSCSSTWGSAVIISNAPALAASGAQHCTTSTCWVVLASGLTSFTGMPDGARVALGWTTLTESNSAWFDVERSGDGINWERIQRVTAAGNSNSPSYYKTYDDNPGSGVFYYRIVLTSLDGEDNYSRVISVNDIHMRGLTVYPNPGIGHTITFGGFTDQQAHPFALYNSVGQRIFSGTAKNEVAVTIPELGRGVYFILTSNGNTMSRVSYMRW